MGNIKMSRSLCLRHRIKVIVLVMITVCTVTAVLFLYKSEELHARRRPGPAPLAETHNPLAAKLLQGGFAMDGNGVRIGPGNLSAGQLYGREGRELHKELERLAALRLANISRHNGNVKVSDKIAGEGSQKKYLMTSEIRVALQQRVVNGIRSESQTQACVVPDLSPFDESIQEHIKEPEPLNCDGVMLTDVKNKQLVLRRVLSQKIKYETCYVSPIDRESDSVSLVLPPTKVRVDYQHPSKPKAAPLRYKLTSDFTAVVCLDEKSNTSDSDFQDAFTDIRNKEEFDAFYRDSPGLFGLHATVVARPEVLQRLRDIKPSKDGLGVNVVMLAIEATSRMNFLRQLPKTAELLEDLGSIVLEGYNIVADGTSGALIPMLTGKTELELPEIRRGAARSHSVDVYPMIWKEFAKSGYATMFAEDSPGIATFNLRFNGFEEQPTDHYMRTFWTSAKVRDHCLGPQPVHRVMLSYLLDYMTEYKDQPHFALSFLVGLTHANINPLKLMDDDLFWFIASAHNQGLLNNTILFMFGDHGSRYSAIRKTLQGKLEERLPYMSILLPDWMPKRHRDLVQNLQINTKRLVTPFDIHETLRSVLHYKTGPASVDQRGISLFHEIPQERTCDHAHVAPHWCSCMTWEPAGGEWAGDLAKAIVDSVNAKTEPARHKCAKLRLSVALHAERMVPNQQVLRFKNTDDDHREAAFSDNSTVPLAELSVLYQVTVETVPGNGLYEGTVRVLPQSKKGFIAYQSTGDISRINRYGKQGDCIRQSRPNIMPFCYCKGNRKPKRRL